jgi:hypothetical protein
LPYVLINKKERSVNMTKPSGRMMDAVLVGSVEWTKARRAAIEMTAKLQGEVDELQSLLKMQDA